MKYRYLEKKENYEFLSSGRVLYSLPGQSAFPIRLASEILQRCFAILENNGNKGPYTLYDPCCGGGYLLTTLGFLHLPRLKKIYASDIDPQAIILAKKNLSLLNPSGLQQRMAQLKSLAETYQKSSHLEALEDAKKLSGLLLKKIEIDCFEADITAKNAIENFPIDIDIILTDLPYGKLVSWQTLEAVPILTFFENTSKILKPCQSVLVVIADKQQKISSPILSRVDTFQVGRRQIKIFQKI